MTENETVEVAGVLVSGAGGAYFIPDADLPRYRLDPADSAAVSSALDSEVEGFSLSNGLGTLAFPGDLSFPTDAHPMAVPTSGSSADPGPAFPMRPATSVHGTFTFRRP